MASTFSNMLGSLGGGGNADAKQLSANKQVVTNFYQAFNNRNLEPVFGNGTQGAQTCFAPGIVAHGLRMNGADITGLDDLRTHEQGILNAFGELKFTPHIIEAAGPWVFALLTFQGKQTGALPSGFPASGRSTTAKSQATFRFDGHGQVAEMWLNMDFLRIAQDLGMTPALTNPATGGATSSFTKGQAPPAQTQAQAQAQAQQQQQGAYLQQPGMQSASTQAALMSAGGMTAASVPAYGQQQVLPQQQAPYGQQVPQVPYGQQQQQPQVPRSAGGY
jgi:predicted ester cyclase